jgi:2-polyprenyl-3-methyl-5-hydroxy-6-metoxy-1,4-benzoquinol methylase
LSLDFDPEKLPAKLSLCRTVKHTLSYYHFPAPRVELTPKLTCRGGIDKRLRRENMMTIADYEAESGRKRFFSLLDEEMALLLDPVTKELRADWAEKISCYLCGARDEEELFRKNGLRFVRCRECSLIYMNPRPTREAVERLYTYESKANDAWVDVLLSDAEEEFQSRDFDRLLDEITRLQPSGRFVDIGCSIGRLLDRARSRGFDVLGFELGERAAECARTRYQLSVRQELVEHAGLPDGSFDVASLVEVLEHLPAPREMLRELHRILRPDGVLLVGVPNSASLGVAVLHAQARTFNRNHLAFYNEETLGRMLREEGFEVVKAMTAVSLLDSVLNACQMSDPFGPRQTRHLPPRLRALVERPGGRERIERVIEDLGMGYRLRILARRAS